MKGPNRRRRQGRRDPFRDPRPIVLIVCEGKTEKEYFDGFASHHKNSRVRVKTVGEKGVPFSVVECAKRFKGEADEDARRRKDQNLAYDSAWCVFDVDEHPRMGEAKEMARDNGIRLAISSPCFELWLVLHLRDEPGMIDGDNLQTLLGELVGGYDKHVDFPRYAPGYLEAVRRARRLDDRARKAGTPGHNPSTNVYEVTEFILHGEESG